MASVPPLFDAMESGDAPMAVMRETAVSFLFVLQLLHAAKQLLGSYKCAYRWYALTLVPGTQCEIVGELRCPNGTSPILGRTMHPLTYICPRCGQCVTGRYGCLDVTIPTI